MIKRIWTWIYDNLILMKWAYKAPEWGPFLSLLPPLDDKYAMKLMAVARIISYSAFTIIFVWGILLLFVFKSLDFLYATFRYVSFTFISLYLIGLIPGLMCYIHLKRYKIVAFCLIINIPVIFVIYLLIQDLNLLIQDLTQNESIRGLL